LATLDVQTNDGTKTATITGTGTAEPTISGVGKPTKISLKVKVGCGDENACTVRLTGKKVGTKAAITPETLFVPAGQQPTVTLAYSRALKAALARGGRVNVTATNLANGGANSIVVQVARSEKGGRAGQCPTLLSTPRLSTLWPTDRLPAD
jgi:hypothetical protein